MCNMCEGNKYLHLFCTMHIHLLHIPCHIPSLTQHTEALAAKQAGRKQAQEGYDPHTSGKRRIRKTGDEVVEDNGATEREPQDGVPATEQVKKKPKVVIDYDDELEESGAGAVG